MGWNEPGNNDKDPWGNRGKQDGPPDLDEVVKNMQKKINGIFGGKGKNVGSNGDDGSFAVFGLIALLLVVWLAYDMTYIIDEKQRGVVLRFGEHVTFGEDAEGNTVNVLQPGLNIRFPRPIETVYKLESQQVRRITHKATMLTQDENIVDVEVAVQWRIFRPTEFIFNVSGPTATLQQVTESAVREVIGKSKLDYVLTDGRADIANLQKDVIQQTLNDYKTGIFIEAVELQTAKPPEEVKSAFDDAIKSREDEQRLVNQAEAYRNDVIPKARGAAARLREESNAYKLSVIAKAEGEADRFDQLLTEYRRAPEVTRKRLYIDAMESVLSNTNKVLMDNEQGNSLMYLPIDKMMSNQGSSRSSSTIQGSNDTFTSPSSSSVEQQLQELRDRANDRLRGER